MVGLNGRIRVGVSGFLGRMGAEVVQAVLGAEDMEFAGGADTALAGPREEHGAQCLPTVGELLASARPDVVVDFTVPSQVYANVSAVLEAGAHCVVGTTGLKPEERERLGALAERKGVGLLVAPNFAVGAVLMMEFAAQAARYFSGVEIVELHHERKLDSPSGTALMTAGKIAAARGTGAQDADGAQPARGLEAEGVHVHSVRLPGYVAHQEVLFGNPGEAFTIRHDSFDRKSFMPGVLLGIRRIIQHKGLIFGLEHFLFQ